MAKETNLQTYTKETTDSLIEPSTLENLAHLTAENRIEPAERDLLIVEEMAKISCTKQEIAGVLGFHENIFKHHQGLKDAYNRGHERMKTSLRRMQWKTAMKGNPIMQIFLGKQYLGQADKVETKNEKESEDAIRRRFENKLAKLIDITPKGQVVKIPERRGEGNSEVLLDTVGKGGATAPPRVVEELGVHGRSGSGKNKKRGRVGKTSSRTKRSEKDSVSSPDAS